MLFSAMEKHGSKNTEVIVYDVEGKEPNEVLEFYEAFWKRFKFISGLECCCCARL